MKKLIMILYNKISILTYLKSINTNTLKTYIYYKIK